MLQTKVDAQCDKHATELVDNACDGRRFRVIASYLINVASFNVPHLHLAPSLGVTPFEFCRDLRQQKTRVPGLSCGVVRVILRLCLVDQ